MSALSIRSMHQSQALRERLVEEATRVNFIATEELIYWHIERKTQRGWRYVLDFHGTKQEAAEKFKRFGKGYRLHFMGRIA